MRSAVVLGGTLSTAAQIAFNDQYFMRCVRHCHFAGVFPFDRLTILIRALCTWNWSQTAVGAAECLTCAVGELTHVGCTPGAGTASCNDALQPVLNATFVGY